MGTGLKVSLNEKGYIVQNFEGLRARDFKIEEFSSNNKFVAFSVLLIE